MLVSLDGMGTRLFLDDPVSRELRSLQALRARGVMADGLVPHMPSTTANTHAALWTGAWGDVNGITSNEMPLPPRGERRASDRVSGYRSEGLRAEPIWVAAARQGVRTVTQQATQVYPLRERVTGGDLTLPPTLLHGYQAPVIAPARWLRRSDLTAVPCTDTDARAVTCVTWPAGRVVFRAALSSGADGRRFLRVRVDGTARSVDVPLAATEHDPPRGRELARHFSDGLLVDLPGLAPAMAYFRLFEASPDGRSLVLFQSVLHEFVLYTGHEATRAEAIAFLQEAGGFIGNGDDEPWEVEGIGGVSLAQGGDGARERRYLETLELGIRQTIRHAHYLWRTHTPRLMLAYVSMPDEMEHAWLGQAHQDARYEPLRRWGYQLVDRAVETYVGFASANDHVVFVSDHGMTTVTHEVRMNIALRNAGLVAVDARGQVDAARSKVLYGRNCLLVHTVDWKGGVVPLAEADAVLGQAIAVLRAVRAQDGQPVITGAFSSPADRERLGFGGPNGFDACFDARAGYMLSAGLGDGPVVRRRQRSTGEHGFLPTRPDMQGILIAAGPRIPKGGRWPRRRAIDVAPLVSDLLGIDPPRDSRGQSPVGGEK
ncbi:Type I phosphodiesterase / nucleotide pyrophosphatase [Luteitalea pratensis]|uniref:Type I phosphodiesterase / nucleotide pyrophosphatase n=1 Tax=Luteitalea pratensis TaxID=1855912 RepID=A0A143PEZ8_LUTPR|nr:Type I phosphodiesterase / nucleotide pyrophosphatase [Luteitalea pratensis]